jgi:hypothetical protein
LNPYGQWFFGVAEKKLCNHFSWFFEMDVATLSELVGADVHATNQCITQVAKKTKTSRSKVYKIISNEYEDALIISKYRKRQPSTLAELKKDYRKLYSHRDFVRMHELIEYANYVKGFFKAEQTFLVGLIGKNKLQDLTEFVKTRKFTNLVPTYGVYPILDACRFVLAKEARLPKEFRDWLIEWYFPWLQHTYNIDTKTFAHLYLEVQ